MFIKKEGERMIMPQYYRKKKDFKIIPIEDLKLMLKAARKYRNYDRMWAILVLVWITGARIGEILRLKKEDFLIDFEKDTLYVTLSTLKGGAMRELKLSIEKTPFIKEIIMPYISRRKGWLFWIGVRRAEQLLQRINEDTGLWYTFHEFRHSRLTYLARKLRASTSELMDWTGWRDTSPVGVYLIREASERFKDKIR